MKQATGQYQEKSEQRSTREDDEMEDESDSGPAKQKKWYLRLFKFRGLRIKRSLLLRESSACTNVYLQ